MLLLFASQCPGRCFAQKDSEFAAPIAIQRVGSLKGRTVHREACYCVRGYVFSIL